MCMNSETVEALHAITHELRVEHERKNHWIKELGEDASGMLAVDRVEAELIFSQRIAAHESRLKELGWSRVTRVEPTAGETK